MKKGMSKKGISILLVGVILGICITLVFEKGAMFRRLWDVKEYIFKRDNMFSYGLGLHEELSQIYREKLSEEEILDAENKIEQCIQQYGWYDLDASSVVNKVYEYIKALQYDENDHRKTAYETILFETGDCMGKADLFCEFMERLGIDAYIIPIYPDGSEKVLYILPEKVWTDYAKEGHAINGVIIEDEFYLLDCCDGEFMFQGKYEEVDYVKKDLITMHEYHFSYQSDIVLWEGDEPYRFKYMFSPQIEEEINMLFMERFKEK